MALLVVPATAAVVRGRLLLVPLVFAPGALAEADVRSGFGTAMLASGALDLDGLFSSDSLRFFGTAEGFSDCGTGTEPAARFIP